MAVVDFDVPGDPNSFRSNFNTSIPAVELPELTNDNISPPTSAEPTTPQANWSGSSHQVVRDQASSSSSKGKQVMHPHPPTLYGRRSKPAKDHPLKGPPTSTHSPLQATTSAQRSSRDAPSTIVPALNSTEQPPDDGDKQAYWTVDPFQNLAASEHPQEPASVYPPSLVESARTPLNTFSVFLLDTLPRQIYLHLLLRLPHLYFSRLTRIFRDAELSLPEMQKLVLVAWAQRHGIRNYVHTSPGSELDSTHSAAFTNLRTNWESFIKSLMTEWKTNNIVSVLLLTAILTTLQIDGVSNDPVARTAVLAALVCGMMGLLYGSLYIVRFRTMEKGYKAIQWAEEAQKTKTRIFWNVWVFLAMPAVWLSWSIIFFMTSIMTYLWRTGTDRDPVLRLSPTMALGPRLVVTGLFALGMLYLGLILLTLRRYGEIMDENWKKRVTSWIKENIPREAYNRGAPQLSSTTTPGSGQAPTPSTSGSGAHTSHLNSAHGNDQSATTQRYSSNSDPEPSASHNPAPQFPTPAVPTSYGQVPPTDWYSPHISPGTFVSYSPSALSRTPDPTSHGLPNWYIQNFASGPFASYNPALPTLHGKPLPTNWYSPHISLGPSAPYSPPPQFSTPVVPTSRNELPPPDPYSLQFNPGAFAPNHPATPLPTPGVPISQTQPSPTEQKPSAPHNSAVQFQTLGVPASHNQSPPIIQHFNSEPSAPYNPGKQPAMPGIPTLHNRSPPIMQRFNSELLGIPTSQGQLAPPTIQRSHSEPSAPYNQQLPMPGAPTSQTQAPPTGNDAQELNSGLSAPYSPAVQFPTPVIPTWYDEPPSPDWYNPQLSSGAFTRYHPATQPPTSGVLPSYSQAPPRGHDAQRLSSEPSAPYNPPAQFQASVIPTWLSRPPPNWYNPQFSPGTFPPYYPATQVPMSGVAPSHSQPPPPEREIQVQHFNPGPPIPYVPIPGVPRPRSEPLPAEQDTQHFIPMSPTPNSPTTQLPTTGLPASPHGPSYGNNLPLSPIWHSQNLDPQSSPLSNPALQSIPLPFHWAASRRNAYTTSPLQPGDRFRTGFSLPEDPATAATPGSPQVAPVGNNRQPWPDPLALIPSQSVPGVHYAVEVPSTSARSPDFPTIGPTSGARDIRDLENIFMAIIPVVFEEPNPFDVRVKLLPRATDAPDVPSAIRVMGLSPAKGNLWGVPEALGVYNIPESDWKRFITDMELAWQNLHPMKQVRPQLNSEHSPLASYPRRQDLIACLLHWWNVLLFSKHDLQALFCQEFASHSGPYPTKYSVYVTPRDGQKVGGMFENMTAAGLEMIGVFPPFDPVTPNLVLVAELVLLKVPRVPTHGPTSPFPAFRLMPLKATPMDEASIPRELGGCVMDPAALRRFISLMQHNWAFQGHANSSHGEDGEFMRHLTPFCEQLLDAWNTCYFERLDMEALLCREMIGSGSPYVYAIYLTNKFKFPEGKRFDASHPGILGIEFYSPGERWPREWTYVDTTIREVLL